MRTDRLVTWGLLGVAAWFFVNSLDLGVFARRVPLPVAAGLAVLIVIELFRSRRLESTPTDRPPAIRAVGWVALLPFAVGVLGLYAGIAAHTLAFMRLAGSESVSRSAFGALACAGLVWVLAGWLLQLTPPPGLLVSFFS